MNPSNHSIPHCSIYDLVDTFDVFLFDAFGVLVNAHGALNGAKELISYFETNKKDYVILSNGSCFTKEETAKGYEKKGLSIPKDKIITSGTLIKDWTITNKLEGSCAYVIGPQSSHQLVYEAGLKLSKSFDEPIDVLMITNQNGFDFLPQIDAALSFVMRRHEDFLNSKARPLKLLLPNPDLVYPNGIDSFGFTSGAIAMLLEAGLKLRFGEKAPAFECLGKPYLPIYEAAKVRFPGKKLLMVGDQIETDLRGAKKASIACGLVQTGLATLDRIYELPVSDRPDYILKF